jgi:zinc/manganese transport system substrate-binding protein
MRSAIAILLGTTLLTAQQPEPLRVCATTPDLGALAREVGGDAVAVTTFTQGPEDPHFLEARPNMIRATSRADVLLEVGLELEVGWLPLLTDNARNAAVPRAHRASTPAPRSRLDRRRATSPVPTTMHAGGNPHFSPIRCAGCAWLRAARPLGQLRPAAKAVRAELRPLPRPAPMVGETLAPRDNDVEQSAACSRTASSPDRCASRATCCWRLVRRVAAVPGRQGRRPRSGPYFADRWPVGGRVLRTQTGVAPTTAHLERTVELMRSDHVQVVLSSPYFAPQHAEFIARATGARIAAMAHQVGGRPGCDDYIAFVDHNVREVAAALKAGQ